MLTRERLAAIRQEVVDAQDMAATVKLTPDDAAALLADREELVEFVRYGLQAMDMCASSAEKGASAMDQAIKRFPELSSDADPEEVRGAGRAWRELAARIRAVIGGAP